jgi:hypothetical protein
MFINDVPDKICYSNYPYPIWKCTNVYRKRQNSVTLYGEQNEEWIGNEIVVAYFKVL